MAIGGALLVFESARKTRKPHILAGFNRWSGGLIAVNGLAIIFLPLQWKVIVGLSTGTGVLLIAIRGLVVVFAARATRARAQS